MCEEEIDLKAVERIQRELDKRLTVREKRRYLQELAMGDFANKNAPKEK